MPFSISR